MSSMMQDTPSHEGDRGLDYGQADVTTLVEYILTNHHMGGSEGDIPLDRSLLEAGIIDSYELIELIDFIESNWNIRIPDEDITRENLGSVYRMAAFIRRIKVS